MFFLRRHDERGKPAGFEVNWTGRDDFMYREGDHVMRPQSAQMCGEGEFGWAMLKSDLLRWEPPHELEPVTAEDHARIMRRIDREVWRLLHARVAWMEDPLPLTRPASMSGTLWYSSEANSINLISVTSDGEQLPLLWGEIGRALWHEWHLDTVVALEHEGGPDVTVLDVPLMDLGEGDGTGARGWTNAWEAAPEGGGADHVAVIEPSPQELSSLIGVWTPLAETVAAFRAGEPVGQDWLPRLDAAARAGSLPAGDHGFLIHNGGAAMRVFVPTSEVEPTLALLSDLASERGLVLEERQGGR